MEKSLRRVAHRMALLLADIDAQVAEALPRGGIHPSCHEGCSACCYQVPFVSLPEALLLLDQCERQHPEILSWLPERVEEDVRFLEAHNNRKDWFLTKRPCVFLASDRCLLYSARPAACRYHFVVTDPVYCKPDDGIQKVKFWDSTQVHQFLLARSEHLSKQAGLPLLITPMSLTLKMAITLVNNRPEFERHTPPAGTCWKWDFDDDTVSQTERVTVDGRKIPVLEYNDLLQSK